MYKQTEWQDRVTEFEDRFRVIDNPDGSKTHIPVEGEIIQVGTPQNQTNFNNMENGIQDATLAQQLLAWAYLHRHRHADEHEAGVDAEIMGELQEITLGSTQTFPFNTSTDSPHTVALTTARKNLFYTVETEVTAHTGLVGDIIISDKALNGFKIAYTGSGTSVTLAVRIKGGMT